MVVPLIWAIKPCASTSCRISATENLDRGSPRRWGNSQARALTWTTRLGEKAGLSPASGLTLKAGETSQGKPFTPLTDDLARGVEPGGDQVIREPLGRHENNSGADNVTIR